ncbi:hypothetical protein OAV85_00555 [Candidatus Nanopelagicales bacterium]|nr:hypothetical protein [Candidatus Nanopelagicales bacterium]
MTDQSVQAEQQKAPERTFPGLTRWLSVISGAVLIAALVIFAVRNLGNTYFWTDESSTFMSALGWPGIGGEAGAIGDAWSWIMRTFLDPGVFHMLVRFWSLNVGTQIEVLRFLPFIFFLIYLVAIVLLGRLMRLPWVFALGVVGLMLLENITPYYAVELRPYSAGLAASVALPLAALWLLDAPSGLRFGLFAVTFLAVGTMQYNSLPIELAVAVVLTLGALRQASVRQRIYPLLAAGLSVIWLPVFYLVSRGSPFEVDDGEALDYIPDLVLSDMPFNQAVQTIITNLLSPTGLPRTAFILVVPLIWLTTRRAYERRARIISENTTRLWLFVTLATALSFALALLGFIPWKLGTRWSIADVGLIAVSMIGLVALAIDAGLLRRRVLSGVATAVALAAILVGAIRIATYERQPGYNLRPLLTELVATTPGKAVIDVWMYPEVRYWIEYSGDYDDLENDWRNIGIQQFGQFDEADEADLQAFLESDNDAFLLRNDALIPGVPTSSLEDFIIITEENPPGAASNDAPILVVRE